MKTLENRVFSKFFSKNLFFEFFLRRKCSLESCATFSENMVSISKMGFEKFASQV